MPGPQNLSGKPFGILTAERLATPEEYQDVIGRRRWRCRCACGAIVYHTTSELNSGRYDACPACGGPQPQQKWPCVCMVCAKHFEGRGNVCSKECRKARRRAVAAGLPEVGGLPPPIRKCVVCGEPFHGDRNLVTCSKACLREKRRRHWRADYYARCARDPDHLRKINRRRRERAKVDPAFAEVLRRYDARKHARHRARMKADPEYAARHRAWHNAHYAANRETIQAKRRARLEALSADELEAWLTRVRRYCRHWRRKYVAGLARDPVQWQRFQDIQREYRHQRQRRKLALEAIRLEGEIQERNHGEGDGDG